MLKLSQLLITTLLLSHLPFSLAESDKSFNQVNLQATASQQVANDQLVAVLLVQETGNDPALLANRVNMKMAKIIEKANQFKQIKHQTINYNTRPIYKNGAIKSWQVSQNIQLKSQDFDQLGKLVSQANSLSTVQSMQFMVSDLQIERTQTILTERAIQKFRQKAAMITKQFAKSNYHLVHINIGNNHVRPPQRHMMRSAMVADSMEAAPALSAGENKISVNINGTIELF